VSLAFLLTSLAIVATPGTGAILTVGAGCAAAAVPASFTAIGCTLGIVPHLVAAITGTAALLRAGGVAYEALKIAGVLYLLYMAWSTWRDTGMLTVDEDAPRASTTRTTVNAILANLLNPKLTIMDRAPRHRPDTFRRPYCRASRRTCELPWTGSAFRGRPSR